MVQLLTGTKGTGKTKRLIAKANAAVEATKGYVAVVAIGLDLRYDISKQARLINVREYNVEGEDMLLGFLGGICAGNYDVTDIFVDSTLKILDTKDPEVIKRFIHRLGHTYLRLIHTVYHDIMDEGVKPLSRGISRNLPYILRHILFLKYAAPYGIIHIVMHVGYLIGKLYYLTLKRGGMSCSPVVSDPVPHLIGKIESGHILFKHIHDSERLLRVFKP